MNSFKVNGHPKPMKNESARGYLLRIVELNGYKSIPTMTRSWGSNFISSVSVASKYWNKLSKSLEPALCMQQGELLQYFEDHWTTKIYRSDNVNLRKLFHHDCRICPHCIKETGYIDANWDLSLFIICKKHQCLLIDKCPHCNAKISWKRACLDICHECNNQYSELKPVLLDTHEPLLRLANIVLGHSSHSLEKIVILCQRMYRPADNILSIPHLAVMPISKLVILLRCAISLKLSRLYREGYIDWLRSTRTQLSYISSEAVMEPFGAFKEVYPLRYKKDDEDIEFEAPTLHDMRLSTKTINKPIETANQVGIKPARICNIPDDFPSIDLAAQIDSHRLSELLHIPHELIRTLLNDGIIKPINNISQFQHCFFDLNSIARLLKPTGLPSDKLEQYQTLKSFINDFAESFGLFDFDIIEQVVRQQITLYENNEKQGLMFALVYIPEALKKLHQVMLVNAEHKKISTLAHILHTSPLNVIGLHEQGVLSVNNFWQKGDSVERVVHKDSYENILTNYLSLNRLCHFLNIKVGEALTLLRKGGIKPDIVIKECARKLYLFSLLKRDLSEIQEVLSTPTRFSMTYDGYGLIKLTL